MCTDAQFPAFLEAVDDRGYSRAKTHLQTIALHGVSAILVVMCGHLINAVCDPRPKTRVSLRDSSRTKPLWLLLLATCTAMHPRQFQSQRSTEQLWFGAAVVPLTPPPPARHQVRADIHRTHTNTILLLHTFMMGRL
jgi:hypothetical protein